MGNVNKAQYINQDSGDFEYYTPIEFVEASREVMGGIDLDPASSEAANEKIKADRIFTKKDDGLVYMWNGRVWLNHPFSRKNNPRWIEKLCFGYEIGSVTQACCITFAATSEKWFLPLLYFPQCFLSPRTNYCLPNGKKKQGVTKGSVITYLGCNVDEFKRVFNNFGVVK